MGSEQEISLVVLRRRVATARQRHHVPSRSPRGKRRDLSVGHRSVRTTPLRCLCRRAMGAAPWTDRGRCDTPRRSFSLRDQDRASRDGGQRIVCHVSDFWCWLSERQGQKNLDRLSGALYGSQSTPGDGTAAQGTPLIDMSVRLPSPRIFREMRKEPEEEVGCLHL